MCFHVLAFEYTRSTYGGVDCVREMDIERISHADMAYGAVIEECPWSYLIPRWNQLRICLKLPRAPSLPSSSSYSSSHSPPIVLSGSRQISTHTLSPIHHPTSDKKISRLNLLPQTTHRTESHRGFNAQLLQRRHVRSIGYLVWCELMMHAMTSQEGYDGWFGCC